MVDGDSTGDTLTVTEIDAPPGYENDLHTHPPNEVFYVLEGEMTLYVNEQPTHLTPGMTRYKSLAVIPRPAVSDDSSSTFVESDLSTLVSSAGLVVVGGVLGSSSKLVERVIIARVLTQSAYGEVALAISVMGLATTLSLVGLDQGVARYVSRFETDRDARGAWATGLTISLAVAVAVVAALIANGERVVGVLFGTSSSHRLLVLFALAIPFGVGYRVGIGAIRGFENTIYRTYGRDLLYNGARLGLVVVLLFAGAGVLAAGYAYLFATVVTFVVVHLLLNRLLSLRGAISARPGELVAFSLPLVLSAMVSKLLGEVDTLMLGYFQSTAAVGLYDAAYQLAAGLPVVLASFGFLYLPLTSRLDAEDRRGDIGAIYTVTAKWIYVAGFPIVLLFVAFPGDIVSILFGGSYRGGGVALAVVAVGFFLSAACGRAQDTLAAFGYTRVILGINAAAAVLDVLLNALLIPRFGLFGAAVATATSFAALNGMALLVVRVAFGITPLSRWTLRTFVLLPIVLLPAAIGLSWVVSLNALTLPVVAVLASLATVGLVSVTGCLQPEDEIPLDLVERRFGVTVPFVRRFIPSTEHAGRTE